MFANDTPQLVALGFLRVLSAFRGLKSICFIRLIRC